MAEIGAINSEPAFPELPAKQKCCERGNTDAIDPKWTRRNWSLHLELGSHKGLRI